ncbi:DUF1697 domain-containing protein [Marinifilum sp. N1E240]|uniref:DUF1697 domain-containing protein n=1 Tax=Marinifilum sp. N1E240 TaxID=2608082 RepID=UPI00128D0ABC|nr:DUF1697 domain-containing protein [Marinifilum sp. N1E240]MPQ48255.1 DUF1697 domain-containing protein [Marinifilum sp. N1E240]
MKRYISLLRGINVGGKRKILMADLKALYTEMGFKNCVSYIQSGNVIFETQEHSNQELAKSIQEAISKKYGFDVPVIVRTKDEWEQSIKANPYAENCDTASLHLTFLSEVPNAELIKVAKDKDFSPDEFQIINHDVFLHIPGKYHQTKISNQFFEKNLKVSATTRNWKTVMKLWELAEQ